MLPPLRTWNARHYAPGSDASALVLLALQPNGFAFLDELWPYYQVRLAKGSREGDPVRLEHERGALVVEDRSILQFLPANIRPGADSSRLVLATLVGGGALLVTLLAALVWFGVPALTAAIARVFPSRLEQRLGEAAAAQLALSSCPDPRLNRMLAAIARRLDPDLRVRMSVANERSVNAFALPGGRIMILRGLIEQADRPEELAAVIAHEMQHVRQRHAVQALLRAVGLQALARFLLGDHEGIVLASRLGDLHFTRADEESADREAIKMLADARLDPSAAVDMYRKLETEGATLRGGLQYLSTHPEMSERIRAMESAAAASRYTPEPIRLDTPWSELRQTCQAN